MCSNYPGIKLEPALGTLEDKIEHLSSYAHVVHTTAKQVISRRRKNENVYKVSKNEKCTCKACKNTVFHCQLCKFVGLLMPSSSCLLTWIRMTVVLVALMFFSFLGFKWAFAIWKSLIHWAIYWNFRQLGGLVLWGLCQTLIYCSLFGFVLTVSRFHF